MPILRKGELLDINRFKHGAGLPHQLVKSANVYRNVQNMELGFTVSRRKTCRQALGAFNR